LQQVMARPHGNLKASNILLSGDEARYAQVVLSDLAPPQSVASGQIRNDLFALGQNYSSARAASSIRRGLAGCADGRLAGTGPRGQAMAEFVQSVAES